MHIIERWELDLVPNILLQEDDDRTPVHLTKHLYKVEKPFREPIIR